MPSSSPSIRDCARAIKLLDEHCPGWGWYATDVDTPDGQFWVHHAHRTLWLPGHLRGAAALRAFMGAANELISPTMTALDGDRATVVPLRYYRNSTRRRRGASSGRVG